MKKVLLAVLFISVGTLAIAQSPLISQPGRMIPDLSGAPHLKTSSHAFKRDVVSDWYNYADKAQGFYTQYYNNNFIFPDSLPVQRYGDGNGGVVYDHISNHQVGQIFDVNTTQFTDINGNPIFSQYTVYTFDSLAFVYDYHKVRPGTDKLVFQFYNNKNINKSSFNFGSVTQRTAYVGYNRTTDFGKGSYLTDTVYLTDADTGTVEKHIYAGNLKVNGGELCAFTVKYIPGYAYKAGDTVDDSHVVPVPKNAVNAMRVFVAHHNYGTTKSDPLDNSYNTANWIVKGNKYNLTGWGSWINSFLPGNGWTSPSGYYDQELNCAFFITALNAGIESQTFKGFELKSLYPNPSNKELNLTLNIVKAAKVNIVFTDIAGRELQNNNFETGEGVQNIKLNTANLQPGLYFCTINAGGASQTMKFMVER